jgi:hypothetical protein
MTVIHNSLAWRRVAVTAIAAGAIAVGAGIGIGSGVALADNGTASNSSVSTPPNENPASGIIGLNSASMVNVGSSTSQQPQAGFSAASAFSKG